MIVGLFAVIAIVGAYAYFAPAERIEAEAPNTAEQTMADPVAVAP